MYVFFALCGNVKRQHASAKKHWQPSFIQITRQGRVVGAMTDSVLAFAFTDRGTTALMHAPLY